jgi:hypothetical protein
VIFNKKLNLKHPQDRGLYAFTKLRRGDFLLFLKESLPGVFEFMQLPDRYVLSLTIEEFTEAHNTKLLDLIEQLPEDVFEVANANKVNLENNP